MADRIAWKRWLCLRGEPILFGDDGYPGDPTGPYAEILQPHCVGVESLLERRCSIGLGLGGQVKPGQSWTSENRPPQTWRPRRVEMYLRPFAARKSPALLLCS